jgi:hypothetical protein
VSGLRLSEDCPEVGGPLDRLNAEWYKVGLVEVHRRFRIAAACAASMFSIFTGSPRKLAHRIPRVDRERRPSFSIGSTSTAARLPV